MTIAVVRQRLYELQGDYLGSQDQVFRYIPQAINRKLPAFMTYTGEATYERLAPEIIQENRIFRMRLFVDELAHGSEGEVEKLCESHVEPLQDFWAARMRLERSDSGPAAVRSAEPIGDQGITAQRYPDTPTGPLYAVIEIRERVIYTRVITLK